MIVRHYKSEKNLIPAEMIIPRNVIAVGRTYIPIMLMGTPPITVEKISGHSSITWDAMLEQLVYDGTQPDGVYPVTLRASNGAVPPAEATLTVTVGSLPELDGTAAGDWSQSRSATIKRTLWCPNGAITGINTQYPLSYTLSGGVYTITAAGYSSGAFPRKFTIRVATSNGYGDKTHTISVTYT